MIASNTKPPITPEMKVADFLKHYPDLEEILISMSSAFAKLRNPVLRKTVARVASLNQAAMVGDIAIGDLINGLRKAASVDDRFEGEDQPKNDTGKPSWFTQDKITESIDARPIIEKGEQPLTLVIQKVNHLQSDTIVELITPFYPAPMVDKVSGMGYKVWSTKENEKIHRTYFYKQ